LAEGAFFGIDFVYSVLFLDRLAGANLLAAPALVAHLDFKNPGFRKFPFDVDGRFLRVVFLEMGKAADDFAERAPRAALVVQY
jgi:hypothetical protein